MEASRARPGSLERNASALFDIYVNQAMDATRSLVELAWADEEEAYGPAPRDAGQGPEAAEGLPKPTPPAEGGAARRKAQQS